MDLSIVIPVYNEEQNVIELAEEVLCVLEDRDVEIIFVDDGSRDKTAEYLTQFQHSHPQVRLVRHQVNCGQSAALCTGVRSASAPLVATLDGDGQNDPADIPRLLTEMQTATPRPVCVCGTRQSRRDTLSKRLSSRIANGIRSRLLGDGIEDTGCGLKLFNREAFLELPQFDHMHRFLPALFLRAGGPVVAVPVNHRHRRHGSSKYGLHNRLWVGMIDLLGVLWLQRRTCRAETMEGDKAP
jgi:dolichol-phosphate mannosyltransferase